MAQLPIVPGSEVAFQGVGATKLDSTAFRNAALAPGRLAAAIGQDVGNVFQDVSQNIQEARNAKKVFDADIQMRNAKSQFVDDLTKNPQLASDPGTWLPEWSNRVGQVRDQVLGQKDLAPVVKRHLTKMTDMWAVDSTSEVRTQALRREVADTRESGMAVFTRAIQDNQPEQAVAAIKALNEKGVIGPKYAKVMIGQVPVKLAESQASSAIATNPIGAPQFIETLKDKLPPAKYQAAVRQAFQAQRSAQSRNADDLATLVDTNPLHTIDQATLDAKLKAKAISQTGYTRLQNLVKNYAKKETDEHKKEERNEFSVAMLAADKPPTDAVDLQSWAADVKEMGTSWTNPAHRRILNEHVDKIVRNVQAQGKAHEKPIEQDIYRAGEEAYKKGLFNGLEEKTAPRTIFGIKIGTKTEPTDEAEQYRSARMNYAKWQDGMREFFQKNPEATSEEAETYSQKLMAPHVEDQVRNALKP